jgi:trk system potassium uptake protein TrkH
VLGGALLLFATESVDRRSSEERRQSDARRDDSSTAWAGARLPHGERAAAALFQSVSARSTGFRTVRLDAESFSSAGQLVLWSLMFIGGAPGSTAGGVKTVTVFAVVVAAVGALRGRRAVTAFGRTIPPDVLWRAGLVMLGMLGLMALTALLLSLTEHAPLPQLIFESVSAANSAGLSTGLTPRLTVTGKIIIMLSMFSGRLGPLILALAATGGAAPARGDYPEESVVIG